MEMVQVTQLSSVPTFWKTSGNQTLLENSWKFDLLEIPPRFLRVLEKLWNSGPT